MTTGEGILDCANCKVFSDRQNICPTVVLNTRDRLRADGFVPEGGAELSPELIRKEIGSPVVRAIAAEECIGRKNRDESTKMGYRAVTY